MKTHGHSAGGESPTYTSWKNMKKRCLNPTNRYYRQYGGRGITVCEAWLKFDVFLRDMGEKPIGLTLDRIDNNRGYEPANCRWVTRAVQQQNRRCNKLDPRKAHQIRWLLEMGYGTREVGRMYDVPHHSIRLIRDGGSW